MADYKVGDLELSLYGISDSAVSSIDKTIRSLNRLSTAITKINSTHTVFAAQQLTNFFTRLASATRSIDKSSLDTLASAAKSISSISRISKLGDADFTKIAKGFSELSTAITPFIDKVKEAEVSLVALDNIIKKLKINRKSTSKKGDWLSNIFGGFKGKGGLFNIAKITTVFYLFRRMGSAVSTIAKAGGDYTETLNLWQVAMKDNLAAATAFVDKMNEAYGISEKTLMNAQATFKNMLGALGNISDQTAYILSEGVTQMALDYASLYNQTFDQAFSKFQAALAGQIRPIRSVSGFDISENTIFQLYQTLGGTKTMRQLNRTEKQLLGLLAIFNQMQATNAIGDLDKTMESYANQTRLAKEAMQEIVSYAGILLTYYIQSSGILTKFNAALLFIGDVLKAAAEELGAINSFGDPFGAVTEGADLANDAIDELNGKLLDFDKFRSLSGTEESPLSLDSKLVEAFKNFNAVLQNASTEARELANVWKDASGLFDEDGALNPEKWEQVTLAVKSFAIAFSALIVASLLSRVTMLGIAISALVTGVFLFVNALKDMNPVVKAISIISALVATTVALGIAIKSLGPGGIAKGLAYAAVFSGSLLGLVGTLTQVTKYKDGGLPDKGSMFLAGEAGAEIVYNSPNGQSGVVNVAQIKQAMYQALVEYGQTKGSEQPIVVYLDGEVVYENMTAHAGNHGNKWAKV